MRIELNVVKLSILSKPSKEKTGNLNVQTD